MNYVTREFLALARKLRNELRESLTALRKDTSLLIERLQKPKEDAISKQESTEKDSEWPPQTIRAELTTPIPIAVRNEPQDSHPNWTKAKIVAEVVGIGAAIVLAILGFLQFRAANRNFKLDQRPWLGVLEMEVTIPSRDSTKVKLELTNSGRSPALKEHLGWEASCDPVGEKPVIKYTEDTQDQGAIILPNQHFFAASEPSPLCSENNFELFNKGKANLSVLGTVWYSDVFCGPHATEFCLYLLVSESEANKKPGEKRYVDPQVCDYHNSAK